MEIRFTDPTVFRTTTRNMLAALEFANKCNWILRCTFVDREGKGRHTTEARVWGMGDGKLWIKRNGPPYPLTLEIIALGTVNCLDYLLDPELGVIPITVGEHDRAPRLFFESSGK